MARTVIVPLLVLQALRPRAKNPLGITIDELFVEPPQNIGPAAKAPHQKWSWFAVFRLIDAVVRRASNSFRRRRGSAPSTRRWSSSPNGSTAKTGWARFSPAMANSVMMFDALGRDAEAAIARASVEGLLVVHEDEAYCQPCVSPVWDTALACHAMLEAGGKDAEASAMRGLDWLLPLQVMDVVGDWSARRPNVRPGGWAFQYANPHYPISTTPRWW